MIRHNRHSVLEYIDSSRVESFFATLLPTPPRGVVRGLGRRRPFGRPGRPRAARIERLCERDGRTEGDGWIKDDMTGVKSRVHFLTRRAAALKKKETKHRRKGREGSAFARPPALDGARSEKGTNGG